MRRIPRGLASLALLAVVLIGLPAVLVTVGAPLLPQHLSLTTIQNTVLAPDNSGHTLVWLVTFAAWVAWLLFAVLTVLEVINQLSRERLHLSLPGLGAAQNVVGGLVIASLALIAAPGTATAAPSSGAGHSVAAAANPASAPRASSHAVVHTVRVGDSLWDLAEKNYGAGGYSTMLARANHLSPDALLQVGQKVTIPPASTITTGTVVVGPTDSLWSLAEQHLGDGERWRELYRLNRSVIGSNPNTLDEGLVLTIPSQYERAAATRQAQTRTKPAARQTQPAVQQSATPAPSSTTQPTGAVRPITPTAPPVASAPVAPTMRATALPASASPSAPASSAVSVAPSTAAVAPVSVSTPAEQDSASSEPTAQETPYVDPGIQAYDQRVHDHIQDGILSGAGLILTASLVAMIDRRRRRQLRERQLGEAIALPEESAQRMETTLRHQPASLTVDRLDLVLRAAAHYCREQGIDLPVLSAARVAAERIDLLLSRPATKHPAWVETTADGTVWTITAEATESLLDGQDDYQHMAAPFPALVSIGHDPAEALILIDLETTGALTITADNDADAQATMRSIALELAIGPFSDDLSVTLVGDVCPGLETAMADPSMTRVCDIDELIDTLTDHAQQQRTALDGQNLGTARLDPAGTDWEPEIVLTNQPLTEQQISQLADILQDVPRVAIAAVTTVEQDLPGWRYHLAGTPLNGHLEPAQWRLEPLYVSDADYVNVLDVLSTSRVGNTTTASWWEEETTAELAAYDADQDTEDAPAEITLDLSPMSAAEEDLDESTAVGQNQEDPADADGQDDAPTQAELDAGPARVINLRRPAKGTPPRPPLTQTSGSSAAPRPIKADSITPQNLPASNPFDLGSITDELTAHTTPALRILGNVELLGVTGEVKYQRRAQEALLYIVDHPGATPATISNALHIAPATVRQVVSALRQWLGEDASGTPYLPAGHRNGYTLDERVTTDWHLAEAHLSGGIKNATTANLVAALNLVDGAPFEGVTAGAFCACEPLRIHILQRLTDTALELTERALENNDIALARWAQQQALQLDSDSEALWRARIKTEYQAGNLSEVDRLSYQVNAIAREQGMDLCAETEDVLRQVGASR